MHSAEEIADFVKQGAQRAVPVGGRTKWVDGVSAEITPLNMRQLTGIVEYEPDEYTITAKAGTPLKTVVAALAEHGQYMPFDPLLVAAGATIGGTVAANASGSGRFRYGGVRDFMLGVRFVDGVGNLVRGGGKVVKNASGFDLPKFMVGSLGRYGILTEVTIKVFPKPAHYRTLELSFATLRTALNGTFSLANQPFEMDALDLRPTPTPSNPSNATMWIRLGGLPTSLPNRIKRLSAWLAANTALQTIQTLDADDAHWAAINQIAWAKDAPNLIKIPVPPKKLLALNACKEIKRAHYYAAGNVALVTVETQALAAFAAALTALKLSGHLLRGTASHPHLGHRPWLPLAKRVKQALDPNHQFLDI
ncbi:MAG: FAD-binding oxidoreductase [Candidatus Promineifilaceae bacterium]